MDIFLHIVNVIFKSVDKTTLELYFLKLETTFIHRNKSGVCGGQKS